MKNKEEILIKILIPIYKNVLDENEIKSLKQCYAVLKNYQIVFVKPTSLNVDNLLQTYPKISTESFDNKYFTSLEGYNRLMLSKDFYARFLNCKYILIYQLDAFIFRDELMIWCNKNYDYVGAPWLFKPKYYQFGMQFVLQIKIFFYRLRKKTFREILIAHRVGNGGFSLRKIKAHYDSLCKEGEKADNFIKQCYKYSEFNEDVFWATKNPHFFYPSVNEALTFSFDQYPALCYKLNKNRLPMAAHGWFKPQNADFWQPIIEKYAAE